MHRIVAALLLVATLAVASGHDDPDPPTFVDAWLDADTYGPGDVVTVSMTWHDDSGIARGYIGGKGPNDLWLHGGSCSDPAGAQDVTIVCTVRLNDHSPAGAYEFYQFTAEDVVGHRADGRDPLRFTVDSPYSDTAPPDLVSVGQMVTEVTLDPDADLTQWFRDAFTITATDATGFRNGGLGFTGPGGNGGMWAQCDGAAGDTVTCTLHVFSDIPAGDYRLTSVDLQDVVGYNVGYHAEHNGYHRDLLAAIPDPPVVTVHSDISDATPPELLGIRYPSHVHRGQEFTIILEMEDGSELSDAHLRWQTTRGNADQRVQISNGTWWNEDHVECEGVWKGQIVLECKARFRSDFPLGTALMQGFYATDEARNHVWYVPPTWYPQPGHRYLHDDANNDTAIVLVPRPLDGALHAVDAVVNELLPGDVAEIVYEVEDDVDEVVLVLENEAGDVIETTCDATRTLGLDACDVPVPADATGIYTLREASITTAGQTEAIAYDDPIVLMAVDEEIPADAYADLPPASSELGAANQVGAEWQARSQVDATVEEREAKAPPADAIDEEYERPEETVEVREPVALNRTEPFDPWTLPDAPTKVQVPEPVANEAPVAVAQRHDEPPTREYDIPAVPIVWLLVALLLRRQP